jgi:hypothetical protein
MKKIKAPKGMNKKEKKLMIPIKKEVKNVR